MRARPEPTQLEHLLEATFLGKLLVFPANVRLDWKVIASYKHSSLFGLVNSDKGKKFYNIGTWCPTSSSLYMHYKTLVDKTAPFGRVFKYKLGYFDIHVGDKNAQPIVNFVR